MLDHMSGGRLEIGLGAGWYAAEHAAYGLDFPAIGARYDLLEDQLAILLGAWAAPPGATFEWAGPTVAVSLSAARRDQFVVLDRSTLVLQCRSSSHPDIHGAGPETAQAHSPRRTSSPGDSLSTHWMAIARSD